jgi:hypothetical protein
MGEQIWSYLEVSCTRSCPEAQNSNKSGSYFKKPNYEPAAADFVELSKSPFAVAEFLTLLSGPMDASNYTGPVLVSN